MTHILAVSMPRSGHHLFEQILHETFGSKMQYCEFYDALCCQKIPCQRGSFGSFDTERIFFMQKSHDWHFSDPLDMQGTHRLVQYRSPVPRVLSAFEISVGAGGTDTPRAFVEYLVNDAWYFWRFYKKWIEPRCTKFFLLTYEELTADPLKSLSEFFTFLEMPIDPQIATQAVERCMRWRARSGIRFARADVYAHRYASLPVLTNFEDIVIRNCPGYYPARYFPEVGNSDESLIGAAFNAKMAIHKQDWGAAAAITEDALSKTPGDPLLESLRNTALAR